jgi:phage terminase large subunit-like protein
MSKENDPMYVACDGVSVCGLTTRELFAAMAMQGLLSRNKTHDWMEYEISISAVSQADALIAELNKPKS